MSRFRNELRAYRELVWRLREYEPRRFLWPALHGSTIAAAIPLIPIAAIGANAYLAVSASWPLAGACGVVVAVATWVSGNRWEKRAWLEPLTARLLTFESDETAPWGVRVLIHPDDWRAAAAALRHAKFNPYSFLQVGAAPTDAPELREQITVLRPAAWHATVSDELQVQEVADVFRRARIRARVAGVDVGAPSGAKAAAGAALIATRPHESP